MFPDEFPAGASNKSLGSFRYYRRPTTSVLYKRPSALCLPVPCQPDLAVHRRSRKFTANDLLQYKQQEITHRPSVTNTNIKVKRSRQDVGTHMINSEGDLSAERGNLDNVFARFEKEAGACLEMMNCKSDIAKISPYFKPRVPSSMRSRHLEMLKLKGIKLPEILVLPENGLDKSATKLEVPEESSDSLEKLLNQLKKCELVCSKENLQNSVVNNAPPDHSDDDPNQNYNPIKNADNEMVMDNNEMNKEAFEKQVSSTKSFNYQDISSHMSRSKSESVGRQDNEVEALQPVSKDTSTVFRRNKQRMSSRTAFKAPLDDNCALELHRSKSYIVNLIDRALSKELGTIPGEKYARKEFNNMTPKKAVDLMNRHTCSKLDKNFCLEVTTALTDSIISNATAPEVQPPASCSSKVCCCISEDPVYIKQLKQLRWGHLRHIQREVKRLENLEHFLDSFTCPTTE